MAADIALRAGLKQQPLRAQFAGEIGDAGGAQRGDREIGLAVGQIDHGELRRDLRARRAFEALVDLVLQELGGLVEQIDRHQPVRQPPDQFVAAPADRRQLAELVEHGERIDRRQVVALLAQKNLRKQRRRLVLCGP